jgi:pyridoxamine 5'-phosphate oxidase family protein
MQQHGHWQMIRVGFLLVALVVIAAQQATAAETAPSPENKAMFSEKEVAYIKSQRLARIATVSKKQQPDVAPVSFEFDGMYFYVGGRNNPATMKYRNVARGNGRVALVFDDWESLTPWKPRSLKIHGTAELVKRTGQLGEGEYLRITPIVKWSMGVDEPAFQNGKPVIKRVKNKSLKVNP